MKIKRTGTILCLVGNILNVIGFIILILYFNSIGNNIYINAETVVDSLIIVMNSGILIALSILFLKGKIQKELMKLYSISMLILSVIIFIVLCMLYLSSVLCCYMIYLVFPIISLVGSIMILAGKEKNENKTVRIPYLCDSAS